MSLVRLTRSGIGEKWIQTMQGNKRIKPEDLLGISAPVIITTGKNDDVRKQERIARENAPNGYNAFEIGMGKIRPQEDFLSVTYYNIRGL
jgi:hypothetical protein